jgi:Zn-dependent protease with chaperone function
MHCCLLLLMFLIGLGVRYCWVGNGLQQSSRPWRERWQTALFTLLLPPCLLLVGAIAILLMGNTGQMLGMTVGWVGYSLALAVVGIAIAGLGDRLWRSWRSIGKLHTLPQFQHSGIIGRVVDSPILFAAQVGIWEPELIVSRGLLTQLSPEQLSLVLQHEQAHVHYRDPFWFFWWGWLGWLMAWLPHTQSLWEELLLLREMRADYHATQAADALVLAETLVQVVRSPWALQDNQDHTEISQLGIALNDPALGDRLDERINYLLDPPAQEDLTPSIPSMTLILGCTPILTLLLHHW